ncbi:MAG TPA: lamin tail domain-containing protein [Bacteroidales bacterium]|nr:lamin tail domain-containing protein [Bacteroidales bacterium]
MKKIVFLILLLPVIVCAQVTDDFTDGDFTSNPAWSGDSIYFMVTANQLQSNGPNVAGSIIYLSTPNTLINETEWSFLVDLKFNPTATTFARVYLTSTSNGLNGSLDGYYIHIGNTTADYIKFYKQTGTTLTELFTGTTSLGTGNIKVRIKVTRDNAGNWQIFSDNTGGYNYVPEGNITDNTFTSTGYFGVYAEYSTASRYNLYYFDDFYVGPIIYDTIPPEIQAVTVISATQLDVLFTENVEQTSAENVNNYVVPAVGNPSMASQDLSNKSLVHVTYPTAFSDGVIYSLVVSNVQDLAGNNNTPDPVPFSFYNGAAFDVVFNEIMADPDPQVALPAYEYLELYNKTIIPINLGNWTLTIGSTVHTLPDITILPDSFLIISGNTAVPFLSAFGPCIGLTSFALTNAGTSLMLKNKNGEVIHFITYNDSWYRDSDKMDGGWSIEQIDPSNPCGEAGNWKASVDPSGGTPGRKNSVYFPSPDTLLPYIKNIRVINFNTLEVVFNETLINTAISDTSNYFIDNGIGKPLSVTVMAPENKKAVLVFSGTIMQNIIYTLTFSDTITDCAGNHSINISKNFALYNVKPYDIVINELMADPDPAVGLPNAEYLELFNKSAFPISLSGYKISLSGSNKEIPDVSIEPGGYLIITGEGNAPAFNTYGQVAEVSGFSLSNTGQVVMLLDSLSHMISFVNFTDKWYQNTTKDEGGWSLEQIDPFNPCGEKANWRASLDPSGGTPGKINSVSASNPDPNPPFPVRASASRYNLNRVKIYFNEALDSVYMKDLTKYSVDNSIGNPFMVRLVYPDNKCAELYLVQNFQQNIIYTLTITDSIFDCAGNKIAADQTVKFAIPELPDSADLVINEILADPRNGGADFVEIYNRSNKVLDFADLNLLSLTDSAWITYDNFLSFPGNYTVLTTDPDAVKSQYYTPNPYNFIDMESFPSMNNDEGTIILTTKADTVIDAMSYTSDMHFPLLNSTDGVSLERVSYDRPASEITNWHSASEPVGYATPAYLNSQFMADAEQDGNVTIDPEIFSPDNDGYNDLLNIRCKTDAPGTMLNITIYDSKGRLIKYLVKNQLMSEENVYTWDGINEDRLKANVGVYIIYVETLDMSGKVHHYKKTAVLATKL